MSRLDETAIAGKYKQIRTALDEHIKAVNVELKAEALKTVTAVREAFFALHPEVVAIRWTQYTPEWQDGENCYFGVNEINLQIVKDSSPASDEEDEDEDDYDDEEDGDYFDGQQHLLRSRDNILRQIADIEAEMAKDTEATKREFWMYRRGPEDIKRLNAEIVAIDDTIARAGGVEAYRQIDEDFEVAAKILGAIHDDDMEAAFGDDALVLLTKDGIKVQEISHG